MQRQPEQVLEDIRAVLADLTDIDPASVVPAAHWEDIGADRFDFFAVLRNLQNCYGIEIPDDDAFEMHKVADLISFVVAHRK